jgi:MFS family permease
LLVARRNGSATVIAAIFVASYLLASLWNILFGRLADRYGRLLPVIGGFAVAGALLPTLPVIGPVVPLAVAATITGSAVSGIWTPTAAMVSDGAAAGASGQAVAVATMNAAWAAGGAAGAVVVSGLADAAGFGLPFDLVGAMCAAAALVCGAVYWRHSARWSPQLVSGPPVEGDFPDGRV